MNPITDAMVRNVVLTWYAGTNEHLPVEKLLTMLSDNVEMRYPNTPNAMIGKDAFRAWYADVLGKYFDETHVVELWNKMEIDENHATAVVHVRWEQRSWVTGAVRSKYEAYISRQRFELIRLPEDGRIVIAKKVVETFEAVAPIYNVGM